MSWFCLSSTVALSSPFSKGQQNLELTIGSGNLLDDNYVIVGVGYGYYIQNGLELGIDFDLWLDGDPAIYQVTPKINYVFDIDAKLKPYIGTFYRRNYIEGFDDRYSYGYRAGLLFAAGGSTYIGYGITFNKIAGCEERIYYDCKEFYTEWSFLVSIK